MEGIECSGFTFYNQFDSANLAKVVLVPPHESPISLTSVSGKTVPEIPHAEFNIWTKPDCCGTEFENGNRTWFYFGVKAQEPCLLVRFNIVDLNRQGKMYSQGMAPVFRTIPGKLQWERIRDKPTHNTSDDIFTVSFKYRTPENTDCTTYFAFTYPFSYNDLQKMLINIDLRFQTSTLTAEDDIYYKNEVVCHSLQGRDVNLITISSYHGILSETEDRLKHLFPNSSDSRPHKFHGKKLIFVSARVHPGETPSSFVFNGFLNLLLSRDDPIGMMLRRLYVFKLVPFLNPDGVALGHYRTDTRGVNLNRVYLNPLLSQHPSIYAARALVKYYHFGCERDDDELEAEEKEEEKSFTCGDCVNKEIVVMQSNDNAAISTKVSHMTLDEPKNDNISTWCLKCKNLVVTTATSADGARISSISSVSESNQQNLDQSSFYLGNLCNKCKRNSANDDNSIEIVNSSSAGAADNVGGDGNSNSRESKLFLYIDLHGHASKKGIFMYGNHFEDLERNVECMLLPKLMSINNHNFHFTACNFTERNMYLRDRRDGMSREGSGRVAVLKLTGLTKSYTLECNYNTGRCVNVLPPTIKEPHSRCHTIPAPPKFTPQVYEEVGKSMGASILDLTSQNPCTRIPNSEFHTMSGLKEWLRINCSKDMEDAPRSTTPGACTATTAKIKLRSLAGLHNQGKSAHHGSKSHRGATSAKSIPKRLAGRPKQPSAIRNDRKENISSSAAAAAAPPALTLQQQPSASCSHSEPKSASGLRLKKAPTLGAGKGIKDFSQKLLKKSTFSGGGDKPKLLMGKAKRVRLQRKHPPASAGENKVLVAAAAEKKKQQSESAGGKFRVEDVLLKEVGGDCVEVAHYKRAKKATELLVAGCRSSLEAGPAAGGKPSVFGKTSSGLAKCKFKKHSLRRLTSAADMAGKVEMKAKGRKKIKTK